MNELYGLFRLILTGFILIPTLGLGQVNIEQKRKTLAENGFSAGLDLYATVNQGNTEVVKFDNSGSLVYNYNKHIGFLLLNSSMGGKSKERFINKGMAHLRYNYRLGKTVSWELFTQVEYNEFTSLKLRWLEGTGLRFKLMERDKFTAAWGMAIMNEYEVLDLEEDVEEETRIIRGSSYLDAGLSLGANVSASNTIYIQPSLEEAEDVRILDDFSLIFQVSDHLSFKANFSLRFDNQPPAGVKKNDLELRNGLTLRF